MTSILVDIFGTICARNYEILCSNSRIGKKKKPRLYGTVLNAITNRWESILISKNAWSMPIFNVLEFNNKYECYQRARSLRRQWRNECRYYGRSILFAIYILKITLACWIFMFLVWERDSAKAPGYTIVHNKKYIHFDGCVMRCPMLFEWSHLFLSHEIIAFVQWQVKFLFLHFQNI